MAVPRQLLCLTMMGCMKPGLGESDLCDLMIKKHAQLISGLMEKYGIAEYTITHNTLATKKLLTKLFDPGAVAFSEYDFVTQIMFSDVEMFLKIKNDPLYIELISQDHLNFSDAADEKRKTRMMLGFVHEIIHDGKKTYVENTNVSCALNKEMFDFDLGKFKNKPAIL